MKDQDSIKRFKIKAVNETEYKIRLADFKSIFDKWQTNFPEASYHIEEDKENLEISIVAEYNVST